MQIDRDIFFELMTNTKRMTDAETKLDLIRKDWENLIKKQGWFSDELRTTYDKYFKKSLVEKVENVMLEEVVDVQNKKSESDSD